MSIREEKNRIKQMMGLINESDTVEFDHPPSITFDVFHYGDELILDALIIPKRLRGKGYGTYLMDELCEYADDENLPISVEAGDGWGTPLNELITFYGKWGFVPDENYSHLNSAHSMWLNRQPNN